MLPNLEVRDPSGSTYVKNQQGQWTVKKAGAASSMRKGEIVPVGTNLSRYLDSIEKKQQRRTFTSRVAGAISDITSGRGTVAGAKGGSTAAKTGASLGRLSGRALGSALDRVANRMQQSRRNKPIPAQVKTKITNFVPKMLRDRNKALQFIELIDQISQKGYNTSEFGGALLAARDIVNTTSESVMSESGSLPGAGAIHISEIAPTLEALEKVLGVDLKKNLLGSAGKKEFSGDIDVALDIEEQDIPAFIEKLESMPEITDISKSSVIMTKVKIQNYQPEEKTDRPRTGYVQLDFMLGDPDWLKVYYFSPRETESRYKGVYRNILISSIAAQLNQNATQQTIPDGRPVSVERYMWSPNNGLVRVRRTPVPNKSGSGYTKKNKNEIIAGPWKNPADIVKVLKLDSPDDLRSYESLTAAIQKNYPKETVLKILSEFARNSTIQEMGVPPELEGLL